MNIHIGKWFISLYSSISFWMSIIIIALNSYFIQLNALEFEQSEFWCLFNFLWHYFWIVFKSQNALTNFNLFLNVCVSCLCIVGHFKMRSFSDFSFPIWNSIWVGTNRNGQVNIQLKWLLLLEWNTNIRCEQVLWINWL